MGELYKINENTVTHTHLPAQGLQAKKKHLDLIKVKTVKNLHFIFITQKTPFFLRDHLYSRNLPTIESPAQSTWVLFNISTES